MKNFEHAAIPQQLFHRLEQAGLVTPTPIQAKSIPVALDGNDILGSAQTGTGKTLAFGVPLVAHLLRNESGAGLVLLPTRELAGQVMKSLQTLIGRSSIPVALLIGGEDMGKQIRKLRAWPRLIVGTPGRINDHLTRGTLKLDRTDFLVLDEVDRMLDMGFGVQLDAIARHLGRERQTLMFSATMPSNIHKISAKYLSDPVRISVGSSHATAPNVSQELVEIEDGDKFARLVQEIEGRDGSILVFIRTKYAADKMAVKLRKLGHAVASLHGDLRQNKRNQVIAGFRARKYRVLVATDVAARGLDIPHIEHVINHDMPPNPEDYIHRIGRTARAGATGEAVNFVSGKDGAKWGAIQRLLFPDRKPQKIRGAGKSTRKGKKGGNGASARKYRNGVPNGSGRPGKQRAQGVRKDAASDTGGHARTQQASSFENETDRSARGHPVRSGRTSRRTFAGPGGKPRGRNGAHKGQAEQRSGHRKGAGRKARRQARAAG